MDNIAKLDELSQMIDDAMNLAHRLHLDLAGYLLAMVAIEVNGQSEKERQRAQETSAQ